MSSPCSQQNVISQSYSSLSPWQKIKGFCLEEMTYREKIGGGSLPMKSLDSYCESCHSVSPVRALRDCNNLFYASFINLY